MAERAETVARLTCLDGLRGALAVYVVASHAAPFAAIPAWAASLFSHGGAAVDVFFALSGLVILQSLEAHPGRARFMWARAWRLYPVYFSALALAVPVQALPRALDLIPWAHRAAGDIWSGGWPDHAGALLGLHLMMAHGLLPEAVLPGAWLAFLGAAWSLSTEWQFYALAVLLVPALPSRRRATGLCAALLALAILGLAWDAAAPEAWRYSRAFLPNRAALFALGVASAGVARRGRAGIPLFVLALGATLIVSLAQGGAARMAAPLVWTACLAAQLRPRAPGLAGLANRLNRPVMQRLGAWSYPLYLVNEPVQKLLGLALAVAVAPFGERAGAVFTAFWLPLAFVLPIGLAALLHHRLERPALRLAAQLRARPGRRGAAPLHQDRAGVAQW